MANSPLMDYFKALPSADLLASWEEEHARMGVMIRDLEVKRAQLAELIKVAAAIHGGREASKRGVGNANTGKQRNGKGTWLSTVLEIVKRHPDGVSYEDVRDQMPEPFASRVARDRSNKSFYGALAKLETAKKLVRHRGHAFTPEAFAEYERRLDSGDIAPVAGRDRSGSQIDEVIKSFLVGRMPASSKEIRVHLSAFPEFAASIKRNTSAMYNVLRRMKDREEIVHNAEDGTYSLPKKNEALDGFSVRASDGGKVTAFPKKA